jgi:cytochrome c553
MRGAGFLLAIVSLSACHHTVDRDERSTLAATPLSFDGAQTSDPEARRAHGERLSHVLGCRGCHRQTLQGQLFNVNAPELGKIYASNLTRAVPMMTDAQLESLLRTGQHPVRRDLWIMPSQIFQRLSAADMAALIAYLRTLKPAGPSTPAPRFAAPGRAEIAAGKMKPAVAYVAEYKALLPPDLGPSHALGRYLASVTCSECHGRDLSGSPDSEPKFAIPNLDIAGAYSEAELARLISTGEGKTSRDLGLMAAVGKANFAYFTPHERSAIVAYIKARAAR